MKRQIALLLAGVLVLAAASCTKKTIPGDGGVAAVPGKPTPPPGPPAWQAILDRLPGDATGIILANDLTQELASAKGLLARLRGTTAGIFFEEHLRMARHRLGVGEGDLLDPATWQRFGLAPERGVGGFSDAKENEGYVFGVSDPAKAEPLLRSFLQKVANVTQFKPGPGYTIAARADGAAVAAYAFTGGWGLVTGAALPRGETQAKAILERLLKPDPKTSARQSPALAKLIQQSDFSRGVHLLVLKAGLDAEARAVLTGFDGVAIRGELQGDRALVSAFIAVTPSMVETIRKLLPSGPAQPGLAPYLGADTVIAGAGRVDFKALFDTMLGFSPPVQKVVYAAFERLKKKLDIDIVKEVLENLTGDGAIGIHKIEASALQALLGGGLQEILALDPFHLSVFLRVRNPGMAGKFLEKMAVLSDNPMEKMGEVSVLRVPVARLMGRETPKGQGGTALRFALAGDVLVMTAGKGRMAKAVEALKSKDGGFLARVGDAETKSALQAPKAPIAYLLGATLTENLKEIEAALLKSKKLMFSNIVNKITEVVERIGDVAFGGEAQGEGVRAWLRLRLK